MRMARSQCRCTLSMLCVTRMMVLPDSRKRRMRSKHFSWKPISPTARISSTSRICGSTSVATAERQAHVHARRILLHRRVDEFANVGKVDDALLTLHHFALGVAHQQAVQQDVFAAGQFVVKSSA